LLIIGVRTVQKENNINLTWRRPYIILCVSVENRLYFGVYERKDAENVEREEEEKSEDQPSQEEESPPVAEAQKEVGLPSVSDTVCVRGRRERLRSAGASRGQVFLLSVIDIKSFFAVVHDGSCGSWLLI